MMNFRRFDPYRVAPWKILFVLAAPVVLLSVVLQLWLAPPRAPREPRWKQSQRADAEYAAHVKPLLEADRNVERTNVYIDHVDRRRGVLVLSDQFFTLPNESQRLMRERFERKGWSVQ